MKKILSFLMVALFSASMWAAQGGKLSSSETPINPSETVRLSYNGTGTNFANWQPNCFIHAWLQDKNNADLGSYSTAWINCNDEDKDAPHYEGIEAKRKMTYAGEAGKYYIDINIKEFFNVADEDIDKIGRIGVIVCTQFCGKPGEEEGNKTNNMYLPVGNCYMYNGWYAGEWYWKEMTRDNGTFKLENVVFGGGGVNVNTSASTEGAAWVPVANFEGDKTVGSLDTVTLVWDPSTSKVTATLVGKYVAGKYFITGNEDLVVDGGAAAEAAWKKALKSSTDSYTLNLKAGTYYQLNVIDGDDWKKYSSLTPSEIIGGLSADNDNNICFTMSADGEVVVTYKDGLYSVVGDFVKPTIQLGGAWATDWTPGSAFVPATDNKTASTTLNFDEYGNGYSFKVVINGAWHGHAKDGVNSYTFYRGHDSANNWRYDSEAGIEAAYLWLDKAGDYKCTWTYSTGTLTIERPELPTPKYYMFIGFEGESWDSYEMTESSGVWSKSINLEGGKNNYRFKIYKAWPETSVERVYYGAQDADNSMTGSTGPETFWTLSSPGENIKMTTTYSNAYSFEFVPESSNRLDVTYPNEDKPTAVENTAVEGKAVKSIENGMLIIEKNGVKYNVTGQVVK